MADITALGVLLDQFADEFREKELPKIRRTPWGPSK
jgi:hypothetical protein